MTSINEVRVGEPCFAMTWCQDMDGVIGDGSRMLWRLPEDMRRFKELTRWAPVIMGRRTWESLPLYTTPDGQCSATCSPTRLPTREGNWSLLTGSTPRPRPVACVAVGTGRSPSTFVRGRVRVAAARSTATSTPQQT